jgi:hypothetical protein
MSNWVKMLILAKKTNTNPIFMTKFSSFMVNLKLGTKYNGQKSDFIREL